MNRRYHRKSKKKDRDNLFAIAMTSHWGVAAALSVGAFVLLVLVIPASLSGSPVSRPLGEMAKMLGWATSGLFGLIALVRYFQSARARKRMVVAPDAPTIFQPTRPLSEPPEPGPPESAQKVDRTDPSVFGAAAGYREPAKPMTWSLTLLQAIDWKRFEEVAAAYFRAKGMRAETQTHGADGGIDIRLYPRTGESPLAIVQCKAWRNRQVGVGPMRELLGVMAHEKVERGFFMITGTFSEEALAFAESHKITSVSGSKFLDMVALQTPEVQQSLLAVATEGDYLTPTCASCGIKMVDKGKFWGCRNYPRCKNKIQRAA